MKWALFLLAILLSNICFADCGIGGIDVWPNKDTISRQPIILIEGCGDADETMRAISKLESIFLVSGNHSVRMCVEDYLVGNELFPVQILLIAEAPLHPGKKYDLVMPGIAPPLTEVAYQNHLLKSWIAANDLDTVLPIFTGKPSELERYWINSCPRSCVVMFCPNVKETSDYLAKAHIIDPIENWALDTYRIPYKGSINIGGNECCSILCNMFDKPFLVEFRIIDASGNKSKTTSGLISLRMPSEGEVLKWGDVKDINCP